jgi:small subunit ribosomal protein S6
MTTLSAVTEGTRLYEFAVLLPMTLSDKELKEACKDIDNLFAEKDAKLLHKVDWGRRGLAYNIKKQTEGRYILYYYEIKPEHVREINSAMHLEKAVLRHLLVRLPDTHEIIDFDKEYKDFLEERDKREERAEIEREEEVKKRIVKKATRKSTVVEKAVKPKKGGEEIEEEKSRGDVNLEEKLGELISDEDLNL